MSHRLREPWWLCLYRGTWALGHPGHQRPHSALAPSTAGRTEGWGPVAASKGRAQGDGELSTPGAQRLRSILQLGRKEAHPSGGGGGGGDEKATRSPGVGRGAGGVRSDRAGPIPTSQRHLEVTWGNCYVHIRVSGRVENERNVTAHAWGPAVSVPHFSCSKVQEMYPHPRVLCLLPSPQPCLSSSLWSPAP